METLLRHRFWIVSFAATAVIAIFAAHAVATAIIAPTWGHSALGAGSGTRVPRVETAQAKAIEWIVRRNVFCSTCLGLPPVASPRLDAEAASAARPTTLPLRLLAIMYAPRDIGARWSVAIVRDDETRVVAPRILGSAVRDAKVDEINQTRVYLDFGGGRREFLDLLAPVQPGEGARRAAMAFPSPLRNGIRQTGEHQYEVQRSTLQAWLGDMRQLATEVRVQPELRADGTGAGIKLLGIRAEGPFAAIGLQNGDLVVGVNGLSLDSPDQAIAAYLKLRGASHISVEIERAGRRIAQEFAVR